MDTNALIRQRQQQLDQIYNPQIELIQQQKAALPGRFDARRSALEQAKVNAFRDIGDTANRRGMFFSGFQPQEQARYLGERFLPGMQDIESQQEQARLGLLEQLTGIRGQRAQGIMSFQDQLMQQQQRREEQERQFQQQRQLQQEQQRFTASQAAAQRQAESAKPPSNQEVTRINREVKFGFQGISGGDGHVSPSDYRRAKNEWIRLTGRSPQDFDREFKDFINPSHATNYLGPVSPQYLRALGLR